MPPLETIGRCTGLFHANAMGPDAEGLAKRELNRKLMELEGVTPWRFSCYRFPMEVSETGIVRVSALVCYQDAGDCAVGDLTTDPRFPPDRWQRQLLPCAPTASLSQRMRESIGYAEWRFEPREYRMGEEVLLVWERVL